MLEQLDKLLSAFGYLFSDIVWERRETYILFDEEYMISFADGQFCVEGDSMEDSAKLGDDPISVAKALIMLAASNRIDFMEDVLRNPDDYKETGLESEPEVETKVKAECVDYRAQNKK
jgi:hypothetical protein